jgi:predicted 3-demethylubiquinone-9 3-methyltransferase (glyoxalase superfamily)
MQKITPFLWFNDQAEEAVRFYSSIFKKSKVLKVVRCPQEATNQTGRPPGSVLTIEFELEGQRFVALNGGSHFKFTEAVSFWVSCNTQAELDKFWKKLSAGGEERECGWLRDKYGLFWQIVPSKIGEWLSGKDPARTARVLEAVFQMKKLDIRTLEEAARPSRKKASKRSRRQYATEPF